MTKYLVQLTRTDVTYAEVEVEAGSVEEAERAAEKMLQDPDFEPDDDGVELGSWEVDSAEPSSDGGADGDGMALGARVWDQWEFYESTEPVELPGAKTDIARSACEAAGIPVEELRLPSVNIDDTIGLPVVDKDKG
jgi:hypothetical protein